MTSHPYVEPTIYKTSLSKAVCKWISWHSKFSRKNILLNKRWSNNDEFKRKVVKIICNPLKQMMREATGKEWLKCKLLRSNNNKRFSQMVQMQIHGVS